jgi:hypothetical protein
MIKMKGLSMSKNLELWSSVEETDPRFTTKVNQRGGFTAIGAQYQFREATAKFGPFGIGWGVKDEHFTRYEDTGLVLYQSILWYKHYDNTGEVPIHSSVKYCLIGGRVDDDFAKKVATDALTKGLSKLGFNADVFMGLFDDNKYVNAMKQKFNGGGDTSIDWEKLVRAEMEGLDTANIVIVNSAITDGKVTAANYKGTIERIKELKETAVVEE